MSKKKRSKILATLLCATTMAAFYVSPRLVFAVNLNQTPDGTVTTDSGNNNQPINNIEGLESITFGVQGDLGTGGVRFYFDGTGTYGGLVADGSLTATDLYITVANNADGDGYSSNRYSLRNALGIHRTGTGDEAVTNIEANAQGHGGMQVSSDTVSILDGAAIFSNETTSSTGGQIAFDSAFDSAQGMTVGTNFVLDSTGKISRVNGIDVQGALTTTGTINSMTIGSNQVNGVTMLNSNVTANTITGTDITDGTYHLSQIGSILSDVEEIDDKTEGIAGYDAMTGTTFTGNVRASGGLVTGTGTISDTNSHSFTVEQAQNVITSVNDSTSGLAATNTLANRNRTDIDGLTERVGTAEGHITTLTGNVTDLTGKVTTAEGEIDTLQTATTGMSYNDGSGTTFAQNVTANDFKIAGGTSLSQVASELTTAQGNIQTNTNNITTLTGRVTTAESKIGTLQSTTADHGSRITANTSNITALTGRVTTAEGEIDTLQTATTGMNYNSGTGTTFNQVVNATDFKAGDITLTGVAGDLDTAEGRISANETAINGLGTRVATAETDITGLKNKTHGFDPTGETLELTTINSTTGTVGGVTFNGGTATGLNTIGTAADTVTVAGTAIGNGSFNGVTIADYNTNGSRGATINGISIYQDSDGHYNVGTIDLNDLTGSGSGGTVDGIVRTDNTPQDKEDNDYTTTIEGNLEVRTNGTITQRNGDFAVAADGTVTGKDFAVKGTGTTLSGVASNVTALQTTVGNESSGLVKDVNDLNTTVSGHTTSINALNIKTINLSEDGMQLTGMDNIESAKGTIGDISFDGKAITNVTSIGADTDTINIAGTPISKGSFNGVSISNYNSSGSTGATINGISIYKDTNSDYIVGDVNISDLQGVSGTEIKGIKRSSNTGGGFTTTIEENLAVSTDGTIKQTKGAFAVDDAGAVTGKDFVIDGTNTTLSGVATDVSSLNQKTTGMTYTPAGSGTVAITSFDHEVQATNVTTTAGADLNELSATVGDESSGLVQNVNTLNNKTTNLSPDGSSLTNMTNIESAAGTIGGISFATVNGMKTIGSADDTITVAGAEITSNSFNNVEIYQNDENSHYFVGDVDVSALQSGSTEINNKLRGITYSSDDKNNYTMTFAGVMSVSTDGIINLGAGDKVGFSYNGHDYTLDDLINEGDYSALAGRVEALEDKTTGISYDKGTGSTTITSGDNSLTVGDDGITANGDTVINGDTDDNTTGGNGNSSSDPQGGDSIINGDQLVNGDQHVTGDSQLDGTVTVGSGTDGKGQTVIDGGNITTGDTIIDGGSVTSKEGHFDNINVGSGENATTIGESGIQVGDNITIDNSGVSIKDENGNVFMGDHDVVIKDSDGNVEASLSDVANRVDGIEQSIGDLNSRMGELEDRIDKVGAMAAAIANLRTMGYDPAAPTEVAVGIGQYRNETGAALGLFHYPNRDFMLSLSVSTSGDEVMGGIGATWKFGRKSPEKVAAEKAEKAREAKLQKAEAIKEAARLKKIEAQQERHAKLAAQKTATK